MYYTFEQPIYKVLILYVCDHREWVRLTKAYEYPGTPDPIREGAVGGVTKLVPKGYGPCLLIRVDRKHVRSHGPAYCAEICAHEATHIMRCICENVGEVFLGWEAEAHLIGAIVKWLYPLVWTGKPAP